MLNSRRLWAGLTFTAVLAGSALCLTSPADGQGAKKKAIFQPAGKAVFQPGGPMMKQPGGPGMKQPAGPPSDANPATHFSAIKLIENDKVQQYLDLAREYIAGKEWSKAVTALQTILDGRDDLKGDFYVQVKRHDPRTGEEKVRWASAKYEANALLGSMHADGLGVYEVTAGATARNLLAEAKRKGDRELLADVAQRYMHTRAGIEANDLLATTFLDRGQFFTAALRFERLLNLKDERYKAGDLTLFKAALAYRRAGDTANADRIWKLLEPRLQRAGGLKVGEEMVSTTRVRQVLDQIPAPTPPNAYDWPMVAGNATRTAQAKGSPPLLDEVLWVRKTVLDKNDETGTVEERGTEARQRIDQAIQRSNQMNLPVMPGFFPIAAGGKVIYRTYLGITAVNVHELRDNDGKVIAKPGDIEWKSTDFEASLAVLLSDPNMRGTADAWLTGVYNTSGFLNLVYENSAVGTLSTDHRLVYAVDDCAVPAPPRYLAQHVWNTPQVSDKIKPFIMGNSLQAFELETGKIAFRLGGSEQGKGDLFADSHFLGVPLAVGGKLYVLNEKNDGQLRLFTIDVRVETKPDGAKYTPVVIPPVQVLGTVADHHKVTHDIARRTTTVHLAYGEGVLVCPTNAGELLGVDLMSRTLAWAYPYRQSAPQNGSLIQNNPQMGFQPPNTYMALTYTNWKVSPPVIQDGKVVFTAPDSIAVHCINLRDGTPVWTVRQQDNDLFLAGVYDGKVLIVGKNSVRAYKLSNGEHAWTVATGDVPSGQGVASKNIYYLPLRKGEIMAIDVVRGSIWHNRAATPGGKSPGNLVFYEGAVLSQTADEVVAYPQLTAKLDLASKALAKNPDDLVKRTLRGELLLRDGQTQAAVDDLRTVWLKKPDGELGKRVRQQLYDALTDLMQADFSKARARYLKEYQELCDVPGDPQEQEHRHARFLRILGQGLESEGDLVEAFQAYRKFGSLPLFRTEGIPSTEDPGQKIPSNVWLRGRVMTMLAKATPEQRRPLEAKIAEEWKAVEARNDIEAIRSFVGMFDVPFAVGREARLRLADLIIERKDQPAYLEAELNLQQLRVPGLREDPKVGGQALDALARLEIRKGSDDSMKLAMSYYKDLAAEFPQTAVRGKQTGAELFKELFNDKRFLAHISESQVRWPKGEIKGRELQPQRVGVGLQGFIFQPSGDLSPVLQQTRLVLDPVNSTSPVLRVLDMATGKVRGDPISLDNVPANARFYQYLYNQADSNQAFYPDARFRFFQGKGHLAVLQVGTVAYGIDLSSVKKLWRHDLLEITQPMPNPPQVMPDPEGNIWLTVIDQFGRQSTRTRVGTVGAVEPSYVALTTSKGLVVLDPLRGTPRWTKISVPPQTEVFGDDQHIFLVNTSSTGISGPSQVLRASDGTPVADVKDFTHLYRHRVRVFGRKLLSADPAGGKLTLRLYDVLAGKDLWREAFDPKAVVLQCEDRNLAGVIEPSGKVSVFDLDSFKPVLRANALQFRVTQEDINNLHKPLLLSDRDHFYLALNTPVETTKVMGGVLSNNFQNGLRCAPVNGWFCAFERKTGEFVWHLESRTNNQMLVLEQFKNLPILLFSVRYVEPIQGPGGGIGARGVAYTGSVNKESGKVIWWPVDPRPSNGSSQFYSFAVNVRAGTINMIGYTGTVQHYVDDGRKRPEDAGVMAPGERPRFGPDGGMPGGFRPGGFGPPVKGMPAMPPGVEVKPLPGRGIRVVPPPGAAPRALPPGGGAMLPAPRLEAVPPAPAIERLRIKLPADR
jgi:outer membrane protein assembly factor BamB/tetratricopeptide (TPR) repeat protein